MSDDTPFASLLDKLPADYRCPQLSDAYSSTLECLHPGCGDADRLALTGLMTTRGSPDLGTVLCFSCPSGHHAVIAYYQGPESLCSRRIDLGDKALDRLDSLLNEKGLAKPEGGKPCTCETRCLLIEALDPKPTLESS